MIEAGAVIAEGVLWKASLDQGRAALGRPIGLDEMLIVTMNALLRIDALAHRLSHSDS